MRLLRFPLAVFNAVAQFLIIQAATVMSFFKLFGSKISKKPKRNYDKADLGQIYEETKELFLRGKHDQAIEGFKSIYEYDIMFRDVASIVEDSYDMPKNKLVAKYKARFRAQAPKESGEDTGAGSAPVPAPKRPLTPSGSFRTKRRPDDGDRAA
jgi:hypothetical protein